MTDLKPLALCAALVVAPAGAADGMDGLLTQYRTAGVDSFSAGRGSATWHRAGVEGRDCTSCHGDDPRAPGSHVRTGKRIDPIAPSANPRRLQDARKVEKWFRRNCKWTFGRDCSMREKGDIITWLRGQ